MRRALPVAHGRTDVGSGEDARGREALRLDRDAVEVEPLRAVDDRLAADARDLEIGDAMEVGVRGVDVAAEVVVHRLVEAVEAAVALQVVEVRERAAREVRGRRVARLVACVELQRRAEVEVVVAAAGTAAAQSRADAAVHGIRGLRGAADCVEFDRARRWLWLRQWRRFGVLRAHGLGHQVAQRVRSLLRRILRRLLRVLRSGFGTLLSVGRVRVRLLRRGCRLRRIRVARRGPLLEPEGLAQRFRCAVRVGRRWWCRWSRRRRLLRRNGRLRLLLLRLRLLLRRLGLRLLWRRAAALRQQRAAQQRCARAREQSACSPLRFGDGGWSHRLSGPCRRSRGSPGSPRSRSARCGRSSSPC